MMMNVLAPSLPSFRHLPIYLAIDGVSGYLYGTLGKVNPLMTMSIFAVRSLANTLLFHLANTLLDGKDLQSQKIFIATSSAVNMTFLIGMRELNLIGLFFSCLIGLGVVGYLLHRVSYIQEQERRVLDDQTILDPDNG